MYVFAQFQIASNSAFLSNSTVIIIPYDMPSVAHRDSPSPSHTSAARSRCSPHQTQSPVSACRRETAADTPHQSSPGSSFECPSSANRLRYLPVAYAPPSFGVACGIAIAPHAAHNTPAPTMPGKLTRMCTVCLPPQPDEPIYSRPEVYVPEGLSVLTQKQRGLEFGSRPRC